MYSKELIKGTLQTIVLQLLSDNGKMYGYEITQVVKEKTRQKILITEGALYPALHKLEAEGLVKTSTMNIGKRVRKYYELTGEGGVVIENKLDEFADYIKTMSQLLKLKPGVA